MVKVTENLQSIGNFKSASHQDQEQVALKGGVVHRLFFQDLSLQEKQICLVKSWKRSIGTKL